MNYTKTTLAAFAAIMATGVAFGKGNSPKEGGDDTASPKNIMLKIASVETAGMRRDKAWDPPAKPMAITEMPYSEAQIQGAMPEDAAIMRNKNTAVRDANYARNAVIAFENWKAADAHMKGCRAQLEGSAYGRQIVLAIDTFAGECGEYFDSDYIEFFHRMDIDEGDKEQFVKDMSSPKLASAPYFIKLIFKDPREESGTVSLNGNEVKMSKYTIGITCEVQDLGGKMIFAKNVNAVKTVRRSNAIDYSGTDGNELIETLEEGLADVAKAINEHFVSTVSFELSGLSDDDDEDDAVITIDGGDEEYGVGDEITVIAGSHKVKVEMDGYKTVKKTMALTKSKTYSIKMKREKTGKAEDGDEE